MFYPHPFPIFPGTRRIVVFSNVTDGFSVDKVGLRAGDLCIHINKAANAAEAMKVRGTRHILMVRHGKGGSRGSGFKWYAPECIDGFDHVFFTPTYKSCSDLPWWHPYVAANHGKVPSTGYMAYRMSRSEAPGIPVVLAGFDPGVDHGTPMFSGHAWAYEAAVYKREKAVLVKPVKDAALNMS